MLKGCDLIAAEDTRVTSKLLAIHGIARPLTPYNDHNAARERPRLLERLKQGERIVLVSDAGTPLVSDPGFKLVRAAIEEGIAVHACPALRRCWRAWRCRACRPTGFCSRVFFPARTGERRRALEELKSVRATLIFFESGAAAGRDAWRRWREMLGPRTAAVAREMTKLHEEVRRGSLAELAAHYGRAARPRAK